jgi:hypothetical protein
MEDRAEAALETNFTVMEILLQQRLVKVIEVDTLIFPQGLLTTPEVEEEVQVQSEEQEMLPMVVQVARAHKIVLQVLLFIMLVVVVVIFNKVLVRAEQVVQAVVDTAQLLLD